MGVLSEDCLATLGIKLVDGELGHDSGDEVFDGLGFFSHSLIDPDLSLKLFLLLLILLDHPVLLYVFLLGLSFSWHLSCHHLLRILSRVRKCCPWNPRRSRLLRLSRYVLPIDLSDRVPSVTLDIRYVLVVLLHQVGVTLLLAAVHLAGGSTAEDDADGDHNHHCQRLLVIDYLFKILKDVVNPAFFDYC